MATFEFTAPDGSTYEVDGPEGSTAEQAFAVLRQQMGQGRPKALAAPAALPSITRSTGALRNLAQGASMGFADELAGGLSALTGGDYASARDAYNAQLQAFNQQNPGTALASEIGGSLLAGIPAAAKLGATKLGASMLGKYAAAAPMRRAGMAAAAGAVPGAIAGAGNADEGNRAAGALGGGIIGGALGAAALPVAKVVGAGVNAVATPLRWAAEQATMTPTERVAKKIGQAMIRDGLSPEDVAANLRRLGPQATLADAGGENVLGLAEGLVQMPGAQRNAARALVEGRAIGAGRRALDAALENMDVSTASYDDLIRASHERMRALGPQYEPILNEGKATMTPELEKLMQSSTMKAALRSAYSILDDDIALGRADAKVRKYFIDEPDGVSIITRTAKELDDEMDRILDAGDESPAAMARYDQLLAAYKDLNARKKATGDMSLLAEIRQVTPGAKVEVAEPTLRVWDYAKRGLDAVINDGTDPLTGKLTSQAERAAALKRQMLGYIDKINPEYERLRGQYADEKSLESAVKLGRSFMREDSEVTARRLAEMSEPEQKMFRNGAARAMYEKIMGAEETHTAFRKFKSSPLMREKVRQVFPTKEGFDKFMGQLEREATFSRTRNVLTGNSRTALRQALQEDAGVPSEVAGDLARGRLGSAATRLLVSQGAKNLVDVPEAMRDEYARVLFSTDPAQQAATLQGMQNMRLFRPALPPLLPDYAAQGGLLSGAALGGGLLSR